MQKNLFIIVMTILVIVVIITFIVTLTAFIGVFASKGMNNDYCLYRYNFDTSGDVVASAQMSSVSKLRADANYTFITSTDPQGVVRIKQDTNPKNYGRWLNTKIRSIPEQDINLQIKGDISLCRAYLPVNNLESNSNTIGWWSNKKYIPIPRIEEVGVEPLSLMFDASSTFGKKWRNIAELYENDRVIVSISPDQKGKSSVTTVTPFDTYQGDCDDGKREYEPLCGRYSIYYNNGKKYVSDCEKEDKCWEDCWEECHDLDFGGWFCEEECEWESCWENIEKKGPAKYRSDGNFTSPWYDKIGKLFTNFEPQCNAGKSNDYKDKDKDYIRGDYQDEQYFWFSADDANGLLYRVDHSVNPTNEDYRGETYEFSKIANDQSDYNDPNYKIILNTTYFNEPIGYLQYRFVRDIADQEKGLGNNTGGYVLNIKQTKCRRSKGNVFSDTVNNRGVIEYIITDQDPNITELDPVMLIPDGSGNAVIKPTNNDQGDLWMRIYNAQDDYKDSYGEYTVSLSNTSTPSPSFYIKVLEPLYDLIKNRIASVGKNLFKNITCYGEEINQAQCTNYTSYVQAILVIYVIMYGMMILLGMTKMTQTDIVIRLIKIIIVSGLINGRTFDFFNHYLLDIVTHFTEEIIANMGGYTSSFNSGTSAGNPLAFMDTVMTKVFFSDVFHSQILALMFLGISGIFYFIIMLVTLVILVISLLRATATYFMAFIAISILIGISPIFLTFILFDNTRHLFDNWIKFTLRYMLEPIVLMAGIIILTQLFTIYLDVAIGYSVCWKCVLPFKLPFPNIPEFTPAFANVPLFCINWFAPWGYDHRAGMMGINMQHIIALMIIAYCMYGYAEMSARIIANITETMAPSVIDSGVNMSSTFEQKTLSYAGLDKQSRSVIQERAKERLRSRQQIVKGRNPGVGNVNNIRK